MTGQTNTWGNVVPLFKTFEELHRDEIAIFKHHHDEWTAAFRQWDLVCAALQNDEGELTKLAGAGAELSIAKAAAARFKAHPAPELAAAADLAKRLRALAEDRDERLFGLGDVAKRSLRFASAQQRRYHGPAASVSTIGAQQ